MERESEWCALSVLVDSMSRCSLSLRLALRKSNNGNGVYLVNPTCSRSKVIPMGGNLRWGPPHQTRGIFALPHRTASTLPPEMTIARTGRSGGRRRAIGFACDALDEDTWRFQQGSLSVEHRSSPKWQLLSDVLLRVTISNTPSGFATSMPVYVRCSLMTICRQGVPGSKSPRSSSRSIARMSKGPHGRDMTVRCLG